MYLCSTIERSSGVRDGKKRDCNKSAVFIRKNDGLRIRKDSRVYCVKYGEQTQETTSFVCSTEVRLCSRAVCMKKKVVNSTCITQRTFGKFRTSFVIRNGVLRDGCSDVQDVGGEAQYVVMSGSKCGIEVTEETDGAAMIGRRGMVWAPGDAIKKVRTEVRKRKLRRSQRSDDEGRRSRKERRRKLVPIEKFVMFKDGVAEVRAARPVSVGLTEVQRFRASLKESLKCMSALSKGNHSVPFFRNCGGRRLGQKFVGVSTVRLSASGADGSVEKCIVVAVTIEEESKKVRTVMVRVKKLWQREGVHTEERKCLCSCDIRWGVCGILDSSCWHVGILKETEDVMAKIDVMTRSGFMDEVTNFFGDYLSMGDGCDGSLVAIQTDDVTRKELVSKGKRVAKKWSVWQVLDIRERILVTVIWRPVSSGVDATRMVCTLCRNDLGRKCRHEVCCERETEVLTRSASSSDEHWEDEATDEEGEGMEASVPEENMSVGNVDDDGRNMNAVECIPDSVPDVPDGSPSPNGSSSSDEEDAGPRNCINRPSSYFPQGVKRSFMMCKSDKRRAEELCDLIELEAANDGCLVYGEAEGAQCCGGRYVDSKGRRRECENIRKKSSGDVPRKVTLFTLNHGEVGILLLDWICCLCGYENRYQGTSHGIYPAAKGTAYTVELLYWWLHEMCSTTRSFRSVYQSTRKLQYTPSYQRRFETGRLWTVGGMNRSNRRVANDALRHFILSIDVESEAISKNLFSCPHCEVPMTKSDFQQLGLDEVKHAGLKRLKGVVIDAKVVGLLKQSTEVDDRNAVLAGVPGLNVRVIRNRDTQHAVKFFFKAVSAAVADARQNTSPTSDAVNSELRSNWYSVKDGHLHLRLSSMGKFTSTKAQGEKGKVLEYVKIMRWYVENTACICSVANSERISNCEDCAGGRTKIAAKQGGDIASYFFSSFFCNIDTMSYSSLAEEDDEHENEEAVNDDDGDSVINFFDDDERAESPVATSALDRTWVKLKYGGYQAIEEQIGSLMEVASLCLVEPVALGFFPFQTAAGQDSENGWGSSGRSQDAEVITTESTESDVRLAVRNLAVETIALHRSASSLLKKVGTCSHGGRTEREWCCDDCISPLSDKLDRVSLQNAVVGRYISDVLRCGSRNATFTRRGAVAVSVLIERRTRAFELYLYNLSRKMDVSCMEYWKNCGNVHRSEADGGLSQMGNTDCSKSLSVFPGRRRVRDGIEFEKLDKGECTKNYFKGVSPMPSLMTVQCACAHPRLLGFVLLKSTESVSAALSSVVTHFAIPPRRVWYDNACNSFDCAIMRIPWFLRYSMLLVDRFHFTGHTCSNIYNANLHRCFDEDRSVAAEVINAVIDKAVSHIAYLNGDNVIPFMRVLFAHLNACAHVRNTLGRADIEDEDISEHFRKEFECVCDTCNRDVDEGGVAEVGALDGVEVFTVGNERVDLQL